VLADLARLLLDTVAPRRCAGCDRISQSPICPECADELDGMFVPRPRPMAHGTAFAAFEFEDPVRAIVHKGKYGGDRSALRAIAALTAERLDASLNGAQTLNALIASRADPLPPDATAAPCNGAPYPEATVAPRNGAPYPDATVASRNGAPYPDATVAPRKPAPPPADAIVAVPLGPRRRRQRGYNQSDIVARVLAEIRDLPVLDGLRRTRDTKPQSVCDEQGRRGNVDGAFAWVGSPLDGVRLWLVDDVLTTGATVEAAGASLRAAGASRVNVIVVAVVP
jgi:predicted amidophosphoribosyltransferase